MGYYSKQDILDYIKLNEEYIKSKNLETLNPSSETIKRLNDEEDLIAFFWIDLNEESNEGEKIKMEGKMWYRVNHNLYTDDRFAIDLYQAMKEGLNVTDIIKRREMEKELAKQNIVNIRDLEDKVKENINKNGIE